MRLIVCLLVSIASGSLTKDTSRDLDSMRQSIGERTMLLLESVNTIQAVSKDSRSTSYLDLVSRSQRFLARSAGNREEAASLASELRAALDRVAEIIMNTEKVPLVRLHNRNDDCFANSAIQVLSSLSCFDEVLKGASRDPSDNFIIRRVLGFQEARKTKTAQYELGLTDSLRELMISKLGESARKSKGGSTFMVLDILAKRFPRMSEALYLQVNGSDGIRKSAKYHMVIAKPGMSLPQLLDAELSSGTQHHSIAVHPRVLAIRFVREGAHRLKMDCPLKLQRRDLDGKLHAYRLKATWQESSTQEQHISANVLADGRWYNADDLIVTELDESQVVDAYTYGVLYEEEPVLPMSVIIDEIKSLRIKLKPLIDAALYESGPIASMRYHDISVPLYKAGALIRQASVIDDIETLRDSALDCLSKLQYIQTSLSKTQTVF